MHRYIDNIIFPAPKSGYTEESLKGKIIFIPRFQDLFQNKPLEDLRPPQ